MDVRLDQGEPEWSAPPGEAGSAAPFDAGAVLDPTGAAVSPFPANAVRDRAGRRFPAHLDVLPADHLASLRMGSPRYDRAPVVAGYRLRTRGEQGAAAAGMSRNHPTLAELEFRRQERLYGRASTWPRRALQLARALGLDPASDD